MNGYLERTGKDSLRRDDVQKWFIITYVPVTLWIYGKLADLQKHASPMVRVGTASISTIFVGGFTYCMGAKAGHLVADFKMKTAQAPLPPAPARGWPLHAPLPQPPRPLPTSWPLDASPYSSSGSRSGSSDTEMR